MNVQPSMEDVLRVVIIRLAATIALVRMDMKSIVMKSPAMVMNQK